MASFIAINSSVDFIGNMVEKGTSNKQ